MEYKVKENKDNIQKMKSGQTLIIPRVCKYSVYYDSRVVCHIPDYYKEPKKIALVIAKALNSYKVDKSILDI